MARVDVPPNVVVVDTSKFWYYDQGQGDYDDTYETPPESEEDSDGERARTNRASVTTVMSYVADRISKGEKIASERRSKKINKKKMFQILKEMLGELKSMRPTTWPATLREAISKEMDKARRMAQIGISKNEDGTYHLPEFGLSGFPAVIYFLKSLPYDEHLGYHTVIVVAIMFVVICRLSIAIVFFVFIIVEGYELYRNAKKVLCDMFDVCLGERVDPAFILNPEIETVGWLNQLFGKLWSQCLRGFLGRDVKRLINYAMRKAEEDRLINPGGIGKLGIRLLELDIGKSAPVLTGIKTYASDINMLNSNNKSLSIDLGIILHFQPRITIVLKKRMSFGIRLFRLDAPVRIRFIPLLRDQALSGEMHFSFLRKPVIDFHFVGLLGFFSLSMVKPVILFAVHEVLRYMLHPHKLVIPLVEDICKHILNASKPLGLLRVKLIEGSKMDPTELPVCCFLKPQSDPYVVLELGPRREKTDVIRKNTCPEWNHIGEFPVTELDKTYRELKLSVFDFQWGFWQDDIPLGFTTVCISELMKRGRVNEWYRLGDDGKATLHLLVQFVPIEDGPIPRNPRIPANPRVSQAIFVLLLYEVQMSELARPLVVVQVSGRPAVASTPGHLAMNWEFAEEFIFPIHDVRTDKVNISLYDYKAKTSVVAVTERALHHVKDFFAESEDPQPAGDVKREKHRLLSQRTIELEGSDGFSGFKQQITLESEQSGMFHVMMTGRLYFLKNQIYINKDPDSSTTESSSSDTEATNDLSEESSAHNFVSQN